jgi:hypothetical protein
LRLTRLWEEIPARFPLIELTREPKRIYINVIHGVINMKVRFPE